MSTRKEFDECAHHDVETLRGRRGVKYGRLVMREDEFQHCNDCGANWYTEAQALEWRARCDAAWNELRPKEAT